MADTELVHALQNRQNGAMEQFQTAYTPLLRYIIAPIHPDERDRELFLRKYYYYQPTAQIAAESGMTVRAVEGKLYRIRKHLQSELGGVFHG